MIKENNEFIELNVVVERFKKKEKIVKVNGKPLVDEEGNIVKEVIEVYNGFFLVPTGFLKEGLTLCGSTPNDRYKLYKKRSTIYDKYSQKFYVVNHKKEDIYKGIYSRPQIGFKIGR